MALATSAEIKAILGITSTSQDTQIAALIPVQQAAFETMVGDLCDAVERTEYYDGMGQPRIVVAYPPISPSATFKVYDDLTRAFAETSLVAATSYSIDRGAGVITMDSEELSSSFVSWNLTGIFQDGNQNVKVVYTGPVHSAAKLSGAKLILSEMIQFALNQIGKTGKQSESIGAYSYTLASSVEAGLSPVSREALKAWRKPARLR